MKRITIIFALITMSVFICKGQIININGIEYQISLGGTAFVKSASTSLTGNITISSTIMHKGKNYNVTSIQSLAFDGCSQLTSIVIPTGVIYIGDQAFRNCTGLTSIKLPIKIEGIGSEAFYNCSNLTSVELPLIKNTYGGFEKLDVELFYGCCNLIYVKIPSSIEGIEARVFKNCTNLTDIYCYPTKVPKLSDYAFEGVDCSKIKIHVPREALSSYQNSKWNRFKSIDSDMTRPQIQKQTKIQSNNTNNREAIDMGGSVEWANMNLESKNIQDPGGIFAWGETASKSEFSPSNYSEPQIPGRYAYEKYENGLRGTRYDAARVKWGGGWRMPSEKEFKELIRNCEQILHLNEKYVEFIAPNGNRLILPVITNTNITYNGIDHFYWTLDYDSNGAICSYFSEGGYFSTSSKDNYFAIKNMGKHYGGLIRPVRDKKK